MKKLKNLQNIKVIAFDADDTLFINEPHFNQAEKIFKHIMSPYIDTDQTADLILQHQVKNLSLYGFGVKSYVLSMIEAAYTLSDYKISAREIEQIIQVGKDLLQKPVSLMPEIECVLQFLAPNYRLIVATKGDLKDQHRKLHDSGLGIYFHHIEVMIKKNEEDYNKLLKRLGVQAEEFIMIGNSLKSDILPVLNIGSQAIYVPFTSTWVYEQIDFKPTHDHFFEIEKIADLPLLFN
ncbi:HAD family hydrolase [Capnocytophaga sp. ARDL2]|uniref:HAD family hydrolase n=1 Tax=Capnocytophaga sp. ARDL2 TaxID=3238809 RepID=UPI003557EDBC